MIKPKPMSRITVFGPKTFMKQVIEKFYELNVIHIEDYTKKSDKEIFDIGEPFESNEKNAELLVKARTIISNLKISKKDVSPSKTSFDIVEKKLQALNEDINSLLVKKEYFTYLKRVYQKKAVDNALATLSIKNGNEDYVDMLYYIGFVDSEFEPLKNSIDEITKKHLLHTTSFEGLTVMSLFADKAKKDKVEKLLESLSFSPIDLPVIKKGCPDLKAKAGQKFIKLNHELEITERNLMKIDSELKQLAAEHSVFLLETEKRLKMETDKAEAPLKFATSKNTFLVKGWIPTESSKRLEDELNKLTDKRVMVKLEKVKKHENAPTAFNHPKIVEPFEAFMDLYTLPTYKEIDPTFFMFLTFPIFFGMMLGDVGYGLVTLTLFMILKKKMPGMKNFLNALILASVFSIVFGVAFGEYFGFEEVSPQLGHMLGIHPEKIIHGEEEEILYPIPHLFSRSHQVNDLLSIAIVIGVVHILIGFAIGFINVYNNHGLKHAIMEKLGWMLIMPLIIWLLLNQFSVITGFMADILKTIMPPLPIVGILFGIGALFVIFSEGITGAIEVIFFSLMSNVLSYGRLMAVGLASVSLAVVINDMATGMFAMGLVGIIPGVLVLVLGHTINIALGILSPFLHSLRLHYVEFFNKFYKGGGKRYKSFGYSE